MKKARLITSGFTIVELLIVIVVIAILAAISIVAYNGIQQRSQNSQTQAVVKSYYKALTAYAIDNGSYPVQTTTWCLGEGYSCASIGSPNATANNLLRPYMNNANPLPAPSDKQVTYYGTRTGAAYSYMSSASLDGNPYPWGISYVLQGDVSCGLDNVAGTSPNWPNFTRAANTTGATERAFGNVYCRLILPDPTSL